MGARLDVGCWTSPSVARRAIGQLPIWRGDVECDFAARPVQAALASAGTFAVGAALPLVVAATSPQSRVIPLVAATSLVFLALLGGVAARAGGASMLRGAVRVTFWGAFALALTALIGHLFGTAV